ncbi:CgeB family protein [Psychrobacter celer]|uniref:CgeB family protein n=1 Tax=Psychrobacter celer TaxID=306572 RepID=UPI003FD5E283
MKKFKKLFTNKKADQADLVITKNNHDINADELANYIRNLERENRDLKDTTTEHNTISYKLGKTIIDTLNSESSATELPSKLLNIYIESRKRKLANLKNASLVDKALILLTDEELLERYQLTGNKKGITNKPQKLNRKQSETTALSDILASVKTNQPSQKSKSPSKTIEISNKEENYKKGNINSGLDTEVVVNTVINHNNIDELAHIGVQEAGDTIELTAAVLYRLKSDVNSRKAVILLEFLDNAGNKLQNIALAGVGVSAAFKQHFRYLNNNCSNIENSLKPVIKIQLPTTIASVKIAVAGMGLKDDEKIDIRLKARCYSEKIERESYRQQLLSQSLPNPIISDPQSKRYTSDLNIACILDEFTTECLNYEVNLIKVTQENWQSQMADEDIDFLLVESCWRGNDGNWGTLTKGSSGGRKLSPLLQYCKNNNIPTVFWNKEDPPHYDKFGAIAKLFDLAITTDINMVERYKADFGIDVCPLSFGAQPKIHNPSPIIPKLDKAVFAGSYYGDKPQRCADFNEIMSQLEVANIDYDIFDRNYDRGIEKFAFPERYQNHIVGNLPPEDIWKVHKGYKYQVNMNSVQDSTTMFARRVYESLASGTPVISNYSAGVQELFGDVVVMPNEHLSVAEQLLQLESSPDIYNNIARLGVRRVMRNHTYGHRIQQICKLLGIDVEVTVPKATLAITVNNESDTIQAKKIFAAQTAQNKHLFIELANFDTAYKYLNQSDNTITYAMKLGHDFYNDEGQYYRNDKVLKCNVNDPIPAEALEDFTYWGEL